MNNIVIDGFIRTESMVYVSESQYEKTPKDFKGVWEFERFDIPNWKELRGKYMGKRTMMPPFALFNSCCLMIDGVSMKIVSDEEFNKILRGL